MKSSHAVYQNLQIQVVGRNRLLQRDSQFHVNREMIRPRRVANALAFKLANTGTYKDVIY